MVYDGVSLALGAASFAFQVFEGIKIGMERQRSDIEHMC